MHSPKDHLDGSPQTSWDWTRGCVRAGKEEFKNKLAYRVL